MITIDHENGHVAVFAFKHEGQRLLPHIPYNQRKAYLIGETKPNYPMPVTLDNGETASNWLSLSSCPWLNPPCRACIEKWEDQMIYDFPFLD